MTPDVLLTAGYQQFHDNSKASSLGDWYHASYQKRISDAHGICYFITICHGVIPAGFTRPEKPFWSPSNQFKRQGLVFNVDMLHHEESLEQVEAFFADLWHTMKLDYYEGGPETEHQIDR